MIKDCSRHPLPEPRLWGTVQGEVLTCFEAGAVPPEHVPVSIGPAQEATDA